MIQHVALEVSPSQVEACVAFWIVLGWRQVDVPHGREGHTVWLERQGDQIHLQLRDQPGIPASGHVAVVDGNIDETVARIADAGYELLERERHWGARRIFTRCPAGHRVELMAAPPD